MPNKRGAQGAGSIRQRPDGRWEARVTVGVNPGTGKPVRRSIYGDTQAAVRKQMTAVLRELDRGTYTTPSKMTVSGWLNLWMETYCKSALKPLTFETYENVLKNHVTPVIGAMELQDVRGVHVQTVYNAETSAGMSAKSTKNCAAILHKAFAVAVKQGYLAVNPCDAAELPKAVKHQITPLTDAEIPVFLYVLEDEPMRNIYAVCLFAGLREGEALGLPWDCVDFQNETLTIRQQLQRGKRAGEGYSIVSYTKSNRPRTIKPPSVCFDYLRNERARQAENRLRAGRAWSNPDNLVFTNPLGEHLAIHTFYKNFKRIAASIGRPDARPHDLRHTAATVAIASGADIKSVQDLLGHASAAFTLNIYAHTSEKMKTDAAERMQFFYDTLNIKA